MKAALVLFVLAACDHAGSTAGKKPPPAPETPDPVAQARDEFDLLPADRGAGTSKLYSRGDFMLDAPQSASFDEGDFIGRLHALFGPRDGNDYVLRHKKTGIIITAYDGDSGPSYGGTLDDEERRQARIAADPMLAKGWPTPPPGMSDHAPEMMKTYRVYARHMDDAAAGPERAAVIERLDTLVSAVSPADWSEVRYDDEPVDVYRIGWRGGHPLSEQVPATEALAFLVARRHDDAVEPDIAVLSYYLEHTGELAAEKPKAVAALDHLAAMTKKEPDAETRELLRDRVRDFRQQLH